MNSELGTCKLGCGQGHIKKKGSVGERNSFQPTDTYVHVNGLGENISDANN